MYAVYCRDSGDITIMFMCYIFRGDCEFISNLYYVGCQ